MIGTNKKVTFFTLFPYECTAVEEYLEKMSEKGWLLESIKGNFFIFKKIEPKSLKYSVDVLNKVSIFDRKDSDIALEYREYCEAAGWHYVCEKGKIQVFYTEDDKEAISIHTDEEEKFKSVFKASVLPISYHVFLMCVFTFNLYIQFFMGGVEYALTSNLGILSIICMFSCVFISIVRIISFILWIIKARRNLRNNKSMPYNSYKQLRIKNILLNIYLSVMLIMLVSVGMVDDYFSKKFGLVLIAVLVIPLIIDISIKKFINKKRYSRKVNSAITIGSIIVSTYLMMMIFGIIIINIIINAGDDRIAPKEVSNLTLIDFGFKDNSSDYSELDNSILAKKADYSYRNGDKFFHYSVFQSEYPWIIKFDENRLISRLNKFGTDIKQEKTSLPCNIKVYSDNEKRHFVLVSEDKVVDITKGFEGVDEKEFLNTVYNKIFQ